jgi:hypothetical protein
MKVEPAVTKGTLECFKLFVHCPLRGAGRWVVCRSHPLDQATLRFLSSRRGAWFVFRGKFHAGGKVTFRWRDSAHNNEQKLLSLSVDEFLRRFLLHLLPEAFVRIRNFGLLANRRRATTLPLCFQLLGSATQAQTEVSTTRSSEVWLCPNCAGLMLIIERFSAAEIQLRSPPSRDTVAA